MRKEVVVRRAVHMLIALTPLYYLIPVDVPFIGVERWVLLICFFLAVVLFESIRLWKGFPLFGLRPHEARSIASFVWAAGGVTVALWLFPHEIAATALVGMALVDPLAGELRSRSKQNLLTIGAPVAVYFAIAATILYWLGDQPPFFLVTVSIIGATSAVGAERFKIPRIDDDFLMIVVPCLMMGLFSI
ncbi:MAG: hypothetical protein A3K75_00510 [Euryarchaeota archaeon RBG_13_61_15]|jgi:dolichol kinase|nr:MAG: hypothetical protein A3K75_00510 [Euryarchaeota archaeon RBG_13_61_15]